MNKNLKQKSRDTVGLRKRCMIINTNHVRPSSHQAVRVEEEIADLLKNPSAGGRELEGRPVLELGRPVHPVQRLSIRDQ
jgi:hypothetical protein